MTKTVKVRIAVSIDPLGAWAAAGGDTLSEKAAIDMTLDCVDHGESTHWVTAELPVPETSEVAGKVEVAK